MPISVALLFCIPIGFVFYYEARWLIRWATGRYGLKERRATFAFAVFGGLLIPMIYWGGRAENAVSGEIEKAVTLGISMAAGASIAALAGWAFVKEKKEAK